MEGLRRAGALLGAAERQGGTILEPRYEPCYRGTRTASALATYEADREGSLT
jgi:hypothetical protein